MKNSGKLGFQLYFFALQENPAMKNLKILFLNSFLLLALSSGLVSCQEEKTEAPAPSLENDMRYPPEMLLAGDNSKDWLLTGWTYTQQGVVTDKYSTLPPCELDNIYTYYRNYFAKQFDGQVVCPAIPQIREGYWSLKNNGTELQYTPATNVYFHYRIKKLDTKNLVLEEVIRIPAPGDTVFSTTTYLAQ